MTPNNRTCEWVQLLPPFNTFPPEFARESVPAHQRTLSVELADKVASATHAIPCSAVTCVLHAKEILDHGHVKAPDVHGVESKKKKKNNWSGCPLPCRCLSSCELSTVTWHTSRCKQSSTSSTDDIKL